jgi:hypothetical protein
VRKGGEYREMERMKEKERTRERKKDEEKGVVVMRMFKTKTDLKKQPIIHVFHRQITHQRVLLTSYL